MGTFDKVSKKDLSLYVIEFQFYYNNRNNPDIFGAAIQGVLTMLRIVVIFLAIGVTGLVYSADTAPVPF